MRKHGVHLQKLKPRRDTQLSEQFINVKNGSKAEE